MSKHWGHDHFTGRRAWQAPSAAVPVLLGAVLLGLVVGVSWPEERAAPVADTPTEIDTGTVDVDDPADAEWEDRGTDDSPSTGSGRAQGGDVSASFSLCHTGGGFNCVVDGDTIWLAGENIRIAGIDAPETHPSRCADEERLGQAATARLRDLLSGGAVTVSGIGRDEDVYGRKLRNVAVDGRDVGAVLVSEGLAREYGQGRSSWC